MKKYWPNVEPIYKKKRAIRRLIEFQSVTASPQFLNEDNILFLVLIKQSNYKLITIWATAKKGIHNLYNYFIYSKLNKQTL